MPTEVVRSKEETISNQFFHDIENIIGDIRSSQDYKFDISSALDGINTRLSGSKLKEGAESKSAGKESLPEPDTLAQKFQFIRNLLIELRDRENASNVLLEQEVKRLSEFV